MSSIIGSLVSEPSSFVITELTGDSPNTLVLEGRALPYRPLPFSGKMRAEFTWYPGNPIGTVQVLGAEEGPTTINGMWKDRFLAAVDSFGVPVITGRDAKATFNGNDVANVRDLSEIVDGFRLRGQLLEVGWDQFVRQGILVRFDSTWLRREDVEWEAEFQWINRGEPAQPVSFGVRIAAVDIANQVSNAVDSLKEALDAPFAFVSSVTNAVNNALDTLDRATTSLADIAARSVGVVTAPLSSTGRAATAVLSPLEVARSTLAALQTVKEEADTIASTFETLPARALRTSADLVAEGVDLTGVAVVSSTAGTQGGGVDTVSTVQVGATAAPQTTSQTETAGIDELTQEQALEADLTKRNVRGASRELRSIAVRRSQEVEADAIRVPNIRSFIAGADADLRMVATKFYGTSEEWKRILTYNSLTSSRLSAGQIILIPPLTAPEAGC